MSCDAEQECCLDKAANHQLPIAAAFWIIWIVFVEECSSLMQICCSTHSVILNAVATQYTCSLNSVYCSHWLVQWSHHFSCMCILVHSLWLPCYTDVLIILSMAVLFLDRSCIYINSFSKQKTEKMFYLKIYIILQSNEKFTHFLLIFLVVIIMSPQMLVLHSGYIVYFYYILPAGYVASNFFNLFTF